MRQVYTFHLYNYLDCSWSTIWNTRSVLKLGEEKVGDSVKSSSICCGGIWGQWSFNGETFLIFYLIYFTVRQLIEVFPSFLLWSLLLEENIPCLWLFAILGQYGSQKSNTLIPASGFVIWGVCCESSCITFLSSVPLNFLIYLHSLY